MSVPLVDEFVHGGFSFENCSRNNVLTQNAKVSLPKTTKTGTTIVGLVFKDGIILGADTRATEGNIVADKNILKIHKLSDFVYCCGAGTAADNDFLTRMIASQLELQKLNLGRSPRVATARCMIKQHLFNYQGHVGAAIVLGGIDCTGPSLYSIAPHGSSFSSPFVTMGSGSMAAMSVFEERYKTNMNRTDAMKLVRDAVAAGIFNDMGSGSNIDMCVITDEGVEMHNPYEVANLKGKRTNRYIYDKGTTEILKQEVRKVEYDVVTTRILRVDRTDNDQMEMD